MAAIKLKGYDRANTNFPKSQYHHEPFMIVSALVCAGVDPLVYCSIALIPGVL